MSNWERRPLRLSQQHYAALDAYCLRDIINILKNMAIEKGDQSLFLENQKHQLTWLEVNRSHSYHQNNSGNYHGGYQDGDGSHGGGHNRNKKNRNRNRRKGNNNYKGGGGGGHHNNHMNNY